MERISAGIFVLFASLFIVSVLYAGDAEAGEKILKLRCASCHTTAEGGANKIGPNLWGVMSRPPATQEGFSYSNGMLKAVEGMEDRWDLEELDEFLNNPTQFLFDRNDGPRIPRSRMIMQLRRQNDRRDVIAILKTLN